MHQKWKRYWMCPCVLTGQVKRLTDLLQLRPHCADCTFEGLNFLVKDEAHWLHCFPSAFTVNIFVENPSSTVSFIFFFKACWFFWCLALEALLERSVSGSEHVVVFSFVMPWVLWTSWGRYCVEGDQQRDCGPANRLHAQVLDNLFSQSFPWVYLGPRPREKAQHGCQVTS